MKRLEVEAPDAPSPGVHATLHPPRRIRAVRTGPDVAGARSGSLRAPGAEPRPGASTSRRRRCPERKVEVVVRAPVAATARVHLVDEGVLRLTGHETPDPRALFLASRRLETRLADLHVGLLERMRFGGQEDPSPGGDAVLARRLDPTARKTIETVASPPPWWRSRAERRGSASRSPRGTRGGSASSRWRPARRGPFRRPRPWSSGAGLARGARAPRGGPGDLFDVPIQVRGRT